jgi:hypothetical protein
MIPSYHGLQHLSLRVLRSFVDLDGDLAIAAGEQTPHACDVVLLQCLAWVRRIFVHGQLLETKTGALEAVFNLFGPVALLGHTTITLKAELTLMAVDVKRCCTRGRCMFSKRGAFGGSGSMVRQVFGGE